ncbi:MAG: LPXTG cell wall anchor domain-containing protein [Lachnospiraceae bacterium]|nr:LPXTG cell wall anchor domain-containing protein [Lachnospiraceae bacterium]
MKFRLQGDAEITVTNELNAISPTGVNVKTSPFAAILGFGPLLLAAALLGRKRRRDEE